LIGRDERRQHAEPVLIEAGEEGRGRRKFKRDPFYIEKALSFYVFLKTRKPKNNFLCNNSA